MSHPSLADTLEHAQSRKPRPDDAGPGPVGRMKALVYRGPGQLALEDRPRPVMTGASDAIVRISRTTICGTDLHILKGDLPDVTAGRILGHEGIGIVTEVGAAVANFVVGDAVLISCITSCGKCSQCRKGMSSHCENGGGWVLGHRIDGTQAEYVRVPWADTSLYPIPAGADLEAVVLLSDVLPTAFECGVLNGRVKPGDTVAIVGAGPIGLAALLTAQFYSPADIFLIDVDEHRLAVGRSLGATAAIDNTDGKTIEKIMAMTEGRGVDVAIEATGVADSFNICQAIVAAGGHLANVGVHGKPVQLNLQTLWSQNITLTTGLVDTVTIPLLMKAVLSGRIQPGSLITHHFALAETLEAYRTFGAARQERALKVIIVNH